MVATLRCSIAQMFRSVFEIVSRQQGIEISYLHNPKQSDVQEMTLNTK